MSRPIAFACILLLLLTSACTQQKDGSAATQPREVDTVPTLVMSIRQCSRLYTSEYQVHKIITHDDQMKLSGSIMKKDFSINLPMGERRIAIPMDATLKAYVDFGGFSEQNIRRKGRQIEVILPDPRITITSTKISHQEIRQYVPLTRRSFSDAELADYEQQGRASIVQAIPQMGIIENARKSAASTLIPFFVSMGFQENDITVSFRKDFSLDDIQTLLKANG